MYLDGNIRGLCDRFGLDYIGFLADFGVETADALTVSDLEIICEEYNTDLFALLFMHPWKSNHMSAKLNKIRLLVLDVDGVMTDGGMYFTENGDQIKKFNTKDGMAILHLTKQDFQVAIISSGFHAHAVEKRAQMLGIQHCRVTREPKLDILAEICANLNLSLDQVAIIGDDVNDLEVMRKVGFRACPADAVHSVKREVDLILRTKGGEGCVREFIDNYLLQKPLA